MKLVVVESPAKAKTIKKYLGKDFQVLASYGHVRDLVPKEGAVDPEHGFQMRYQAIERNQRHVHAIAKMLRQADTLYLATDPDREGEAISWHLYEMLKDDGLLAKKTVYRIAFNEITQHAVKEAVAHPRQLSTELINAQQARRALDYLVGFKLSPLLWRKIRRGLSAGRVQSPALRLIVEREVEIEEFKIREYWTIEADVSYQKQAFHARLTHYQQNKLDQFAITDETAAKAIEADLLAAAKGQLFISKVEKKQRKRNPAAPFITSTLQQEASRKLGFTTKRTMQIAQQLYEGIEINGSSIGLITYMRTDSVNLAKEAVQEIREIIQARFGADQLPAQARHYKTKAKNAQEAHEAIRPTSVQRTPQELKATLKPDQYRLYELIWKRTIACQMRHATINQVAADLTCKTTGVFRATGSSIADPGFMVVYREGVDDAKVGDNDERMLPPLVEGEWVQLLALRPEQHFTEPPPRYNEATLVKALEEYGIGRPSTYAAIISTLQDRDYVELTNKRFHPTDVGRVVNRFLTQYFTQYVDYDFTARLEDQLDAVSRGEQNWIPLLENFWSPFKEQIAHTEKTVQRSDVTHETLDEACPKCNSPLSIRLGRYGRFIGCTQHPECDYTRDLNPDKQGSTAESPEVIEGRQCPQCGSPLVVRRGRYGKFIGCSGYPKCRYIEPLEKPVDTGVTCPRCQAGTLLQRRSKRGKTFYSCSTYPKCDYAVWNRPIAEPCPQCGWPILTLKQTKDRQQKVCPQKECGYTVDIEATQDMAH